MRPLLSGWVAVYKPRGVFSMGTCVAAVCRDPATAHIHGGTMCAAVARTRCRLPSGSGESDGSYESGALWDLGCASRRYVPQCRGSQACRCCGHSVPPTCLPLQACSRLHWVVPHGSSSTCRTRRCTKHPSSSAQVQCGQLESAYRSASVSCQALFCAALSNVSKSLAWSGDLSSGKCDIP